MIAYILPLIGLFFLVLGMAFLCRARAADITSTTSTTRRKLGLIYMVVGAMLTALGLMRI